MNLGRGIDSETIKKGLAELNPEINTDPMSRLPDQWKPYFADANGKPLHAGEAQGLHFGMNYVTSLDRGIVPEWTVQELEDGLVEVPASMAEQEGVSTLYYQILPTDPQWHDAYMKATAHSDNYFFEDMKLFHREFVKMGKVPGRIVRQGWRDTFAYLIRYKIPGVTRRSLELKFGVDLSPEAQAPPVVDAASILGEAIHA